jgi:hypothetical protein
MLDSKIRGGGAAPTGAPPAADPYAGKTMLRSA